MTAAMLLNLLLAAVMGVVDTAAHGEARARSGARARAC